MPYQPGYTAPPPRSNDTAIDISGSWVVAGAPLNLSDPCLLAMAAAERHLLESEYDEYADNNANGAAFCRSATLILMALLLLRHALTFTNPDGDEDDVSTFFSAMARYVRREANCLALTDSATMFFGNFMFAPLKNTQPKPTQSL